MYHIRTTKTASGATAVQVVRYVERKTKLAVHIGSAHNQDEIKTLKLMAESWVERNSKQSCLFNVSNKPSGLAVLDKCEYLGIRYTFIYETLCKLLNRFRFSSIGNKLLLDLLIMRLIEPVSKLESIELLKDFFGITHRRQSFYESIPKMVKMKGEIEGLVADVAIKEFGFDFSMVFYDVTTLYFESFTADELRKPGFSKDSKSNQPQIVIGLMVNRLGFPLGYEIFEGNKFEGHTMIPVIRSFQAKYGIETLTVVADAAMISTENIEALKANGLTYIVGGRMGNLSKTKIVEISKRLKRVDKASIRTETKHGTLVCDFSVKRYKKDKNEMEKQLKKATYYLGHPAKMRRTKFLKNLGKNNFGLNSELMEKTNSLLGIKGYYTNLEEEVSDRDIVGHYHNLWHVEQAFRIAKSDLQMRPIFHFKQDTIRTHILICFMALATAKYMEIKTGKSLAQIIKLLKRVTDARILNLITKEEIVMRTKIPKDVSDIIKDLGLSY